MSLSGKQSPLSINLISQLIQNQGITTLQLEMLGRSFNAVAYTHQSGLTFTTGDIVTIAGVNPSGYNTTSGVVYVSIDDITTVLYPIDGAILPPYVSGGTIAMTSAPGNTKNITAVELEYEPGSLVTGTVLDKLQKAMRMAYTIQGSTDITNTTMANLQNIGAGYILALGNGKPESYTDSYTVSEGRYGFLALPAETLTNEYFFITGNLTEFCYNFNTCYSFKTQSNNIIASMANSTDYLNGIYSNMNDLTTSDVTGVNLATVYWGQDLIKLGRALDLSRIETFGQPSSLLQTLVANNALTRNVSLALLAAGLTTEELGNIIGNLALPTVDQEKRIYSGFSLIVGPDLTEVCTLLNVQTEGLLQLSDLLNPKLMFPNSYKSLTVPKYNSMPMETNSKTYYLIYDSGSVNTALRSFGSNLFGLVPDEIAITAGSFSASMLQIKNIARMNIEKFAQVVTNLETTKLLAVNGTSVPVDVPVVDTALSTIALGSGTYGTYRMVDFFGLLSGLNYNFYQIKSYITQLQTPTLSSIYQDMIDLIEAPSSVKDADLQVLINQANVEIMTIFNNKNKTAKALNQLYENVGTLLLIERNARALAMPTTENITTSVQDIYAFVNNMAQYAVDTSTGETAQVLESLANTATIGGQSLIALMRESRNAYRLGLAGGILDNNISNQVPVTVGNGLGIPRVTGASTVPGSFAGSSATNLVPPNLDIFNISATPLLPSTLTPEEAIDQVVRDNCTCWE